MQITVLGYWGAYPEKGEATAGYLLQTGEQNILLDCGSGVLSQLFRYLPLEKLDAVILSHYHHDHVADLGCLQYAVMINSRFGRLKKTLPVYGHRQSELFGKLSYNGFTIGKEIKAGETLQMDGLKIDFLATVHEEYNLAMRFEHGGKKIVYTGDTGYSEDLIPFFSGCDLVISEANLYANQQGQVAGHLTSTEAGRLASKAGVGRLVLTHFPHYGDINRLLYEAQESFKGTVEMAATGKIFYV